MKTTEKYFAVVLFIMLCKVLPGIASVDEILKCDHSTKATEQYFPVVLVFILYKIVPTVEFVDQIVKCLPK